MRDSTGFSWSSLWPSYVWGSLLGTTVARMSFSSSCGDRLSFDWFLPSLFMSLTFILCVVCLVLLWKRVPSPLPYGTCYVSTCPWELSSLLPDCLFVAMFASGYIIESWSSNMCWGVFRYLDLVATSSHYCCSDYLDFFLVAMSAVIRHLVITADDCDACRRCPFRCLPWRRHGLSCSLIRRLGFLWYTHLYFRCYCALNFSGRTNVLGLIPIHDHMMMMVMWLLTLSPSSHHHLTRPVQEVSFSFLNLCLLGHSCWLPAESRLHIPRPALRGR